MIKIFDGSFLYNLAIKNDCKFKCYAWKDEYSSGYFESEDRTISIMFKSTKKESVKDFVLVDFSVNNFNNSKTDILSVIENILEQLKKG